MQNEFGREFGKRLQQVLEDKDLSRQRAAGKVGSTNVTIGHWARGDVPYCIEVLRGFREQFGVDLNWLITGKGK